MQQHLFRQLRRWGRATFSAASKVCSSISSFFCVSLLQRPQKKRSRKASFRWLPNWQVEAGCFRLAASAVTLWPSRCVRLRNLYLSVITIFFDVKWFFRRMVSCVYAKEKFVSLNKGVFDRLRSTGSKALFSFVYMPWLYQICMAKCLYSYRDELLKKFGQNRFPLEQLKSTSEWRSLHRNVFA